MTRIVSIMACSFENKGRQPNGGLLGRHRAAFLFRIICKLPAVINNRWAKCLKAGAGRRRAVVVWLASAERFHGSPAPEPRTITEDEASDERHHREDEEDEEEDLRPSPGDAFNCSEADKGSDQSDDE